MKTTMMMFAAAATVTAAGRSGAADGTHHPGSEEPPTIPEYWHSTGIQYISSPDTPPPFPHNNGVPAAPYVAGRMETYYDWSRRSMIEHYLDECVPIFPQAGPNDPGFECSFVNVNETSFLITYNDTCVSIVKLFLRRCALTQWMCRCAFLFVAPCAPCRSVPITALVRWRRCVRLMMPTNDEFGPACLWVGRCLRFGAPGPCSPSCCAAERTIVSLFRTLMPLFAFRRPSWALPCCVFGKPWHPPTPSFLQNFTKRELPKSSPINGTEVRK